MGPDAHNQRVVASVQDQAAQADLTPFLPLLTLRWLHDHPERRWLEVDGTLAFVDISGFTALSERLSGLGKAGAEELTDVIDSRFASLLAVAYEYGGGLLKFGGDALLLLFSGADHAARAARAAFEMRATLRTIGRVSTAAGSVTLRMHVGIHSGTFHCFLVGDTHRELIVAGAGATATVDMEAASVAGEILISPAVAGMLDARCVGPASGPGLLLRSKPEVTSAPPLPVDRADVLLEHAIPTALRTQLLEAGPLEGEHRQCGVAFIRFDAVDELIGLTGPDAAAETLDELVCIVQHAADDHGVTFLQSDVDRDGGKFILLAGAPQTREDNEERLLRTVRAIVDAAPPLGLHVGVSRGRIFAGQVGFRYRRTYTAMGDTMALAARLMARAGAGEILVAAEAFERSHDRFDAVEREPFTAKGISVPVRAFALGKLRAQRVSEAPPRVPFVGRERERGVLRAAAVAARGGTGRLVEIVGEPGIGKSRLADELRLESPDMLALTVRCEQYEATTPYGSLRPMLHALLDVDLEGDAAHNFRALSERLASADPDLVPWAPLLAVVLDAEVESTAEVDDLDPSFRRARLHAVLTRLLEKLLASPTLLFFEDVHWMDDASAEFLHHLAARLSLFPVLVCVTRRPVGTGFSAGGRAVTLELESLGAEESRLLVEAVAERTVSIEAARSLAERGDGNPLFLQALAVASLDADELPETVEALLATQIDGLPPGERALLRWAAVLGVTFSGSLMSEILSDESAAPTFEVGLEEFVEPDPTTPDGFRFRHALVRDVAYEGLPYRRRRELHGRAAEAIERRHAADPNVAAELLSLHFLRAGRWASAWGYSLEAGRRAREKWANVEAAEFYRRAIESARQLTSLDAQQVAAAWEALGECLWLSGKLDAAARAFSEARRMTVKDAPAHIALMNKEGKVREDMAKYSDALRWYTRGLRLAQRVEDDAARTRLELELNMSYADARFRQGAFEECIARCHYVVEQALAAGESLQLGRAYMMIYGAYTAIGSPERAAFRGLALPIFEDLNDLKRQATTLNNLGIEAYYEGDWGKALDVYERARELFERIGDVTSVAMATNNIGEILSDQGRLDEAEELFVTVRRAADAAGHRLFAAIAVLNLGRVAARAGRFDDAEAELLQAAEAFREIRAESYALETEVRLAEASVLRGDRLEPALVQLDGVLPRTGAGAGMASVHALALRLKGSALLQLGHTDDASDAFGDSVAVARAAGVIYEEALALDGLAASSDDPKAAAESAALLAGLRVESVRRPPLGAAAAQPRSARSPGRIVR
jgi:class 3 adenylate cyclase/tetratricopeptide (TPR) repeat protein